MMQGVTLGFRVADVQVPVSAEEAILTVELTGAQLNTNVQIQFNTTDGTALGGYVYDFLRDVKELTLFTKKFHIHSSHMLCS